MDVVRLFGAAAALAAVCIGGGASASTFIKTDVPELTLSSEVIVRGVVKRVQSRWAGDGSMIVTDVEVVVSESLKGQPDRTVVITQPGGSVGDIGQKVSGLASFAEGEEVLVFLGPKRKGHFQVRGALQGKYRIERSSPSGPARAVPESDHGARLLSRTTGETVEADTQSLAWEDLRARVRRALRTAPRSGKPKP